MMMPFQILGMWFRSLLSLALIGAGIYCLYAWNERRETVVHEQVRVAEADREGEVEANGEPATRVRQRVARWEFGWNPATAFLVGGIGLLAWSFGGGWLAYPRLWRRRGKDEPHSVRNGEPLRVRRQDGSELHIECYGPPNATQIVMIHGWGLDSEEWYYAKKELSRNHRLIVWDLPGLGKSASPADRDWSLDKLARDLDAVIDATSQKPVVLLGHSIGGMIVLTYCKLFPQKVATQVSGLVLAHSTFTNPIRTTRGAAILEVIQKPIIEPLCYLMIWLSPLVWLMNWLSYINGSAHRSTESSSFSGNETRGQLDFLAKYYTVASPAVVARGFLGMMRTYDATNVLPTIPVPTLVVAGDKDNTCIPEASMHMAATIPNARLVMLSPARHCGLFEHHEAFHQEVANFVSNIETGTRKTRTASTSQVAEAR